MGKFLKNKKLKIVVLILTLMIIIVGVTAFYLNPYQGTISWERMQNSLPYTKSLSKEQAASELKYLIDLIKDRHYSSIATLPPKVLVQYDQELKNLPKIPDVVDVWRAGSRILKQLEDAHSAMYHMESVRGNGLKRLDIDWKFTDNVLTSKSGTHAGQKVEQIEGIAVSELYHRFLSQFSYENIYYAEYSFPGYMKRRNTLYWLGVECTDGVRITFNQSGVPVSEVYPFREVAPTDKPEFVRYTVDEEKGVGIFTLDSCRLNEEYTGTLKQFFTAVKNNQIKYIAVDLRNNGGGNSGVANEFLRYLPVDSYLDFGSKIRFKFWSVDHPVSSSKNNRYDDLLFNGKVYVITSKSTFSSAMWFAVLLKDNGLAEVIGEPPGNKPSAYGDVLTFQMPDSKLAVSLTYKKFSRPKVEKDNEEALLPDYPVDQAEAIEEFYKIVEQQ